MADPDVISSGNETYHYECLLSGNCYLIPTTPHNRPHKLNWDDAQSWCFRHASVLTVIENEQENSDVARFGFRVQGLMSAFIGARAGGWVTSQQPLEENHRDEYNYMNENETYVFLNIDGTASDLPIQYATTGPPKEMAYIVLLAFSYRKPINISPSFWGMHLNYICQLPLRSPQCILQSSYTNNITCFVQNSTEPAKCNWYAARNKCRKLGGDLAIIDTETWSSTEFREWLLREVRYWIGVRRNWWRWARGVQQDTFSSQDMLYSNQDHIWEDAINYHWYHCMTVRIDFPFFWYPENCSLPQAFICQNRSVTVAKQIPAAITSEQELQATEKGIPAGEHYLDIQSYSFVNDTDSEIETRATAGDSHMISSGYILIVVGVILIAISICVLSIALFAFRFRRPTAGGPRVDRARCPRIYTPLQPNIPVNQASMVENKARRQLPKWPSVRTTLLPQAAEHAAADADNVDDVDNPDEYNYLEPNNNAYNMYNTIYD